MNKKIKSYAASIGVDVDTLLSAIRYAKYITTMNIHFGCGCGCGGDTVDYDKFSTGMKAIDHLKIGDI